ncbi:DUF4129 domain-containing protein [Luteimonas sp. SDU82]|uniref:DUF4129 domain-containing protein n=1 Tax=Luteimonas sp. SDU82 TaxID=3422592 RepID=UPI003EBF2F5A
MRLDRVRLELRPRSPWEAMELGNALVRRHAAAIWRPWALTTLPLFVLLNAAAWAVDALWLAALAMWWLLPLFDRLVLFVLSRSVFGEVPGTREALAAPWRGGWRAAVARLGWRRPSPWRSIAMPVEMLEGVSGEALARRRAVIVDGIQGHAALLAGTCLLFVGVLVVSLLLLVMMFVPEELLSESARAMFTLIIQDPPRIAQLGFNAALWLAISAVEPFHVGAGFGLYLNRRVRIEAWDIEIVLRRLRARLAQAVVLLLAVAALPLLAPQAHAQAGQGVQEPGEVIRQRLRAKEIAAEENRARRPTLPRVFGKDAVVDHAPFRQAVKRAYEDPLLTRSRTEASWRLRQERPAPPPRTPPPWLRGLGQVLAVVGEFGLWILLGLVVLALALTARRWLPWMRGARGRRELPSAVSVSAAPEPDVLPDDLVAQARRLWREGRPRRALALLYRGSVEAMAARIGSALVPGATEAECLRASRRMPEPADRESFARMVRVWQLAAYAQRLPRDEEFESLLADLSQRFGWAR